MFYAKYPITTRITERSDMSYSDPTMTRTRISPIKRTFKKQRFAQGASVRFRNSREMYQTIGVSLSVYVGLLTISSISLGTKLLEDTVLINFPRKFNTANFTSRHFYLPPQISYPVDLPEVVDNKVRNAAYASVANFVRISGNAQLPDVTLRPPLRNREQDSRIYPSPIYVKNKQTQQFPTHDEWQTDTNSVSDFVKVNEMSCENSGKSVIFTASFIANKNTDNPVIEDAASEYCKIEKTKDEYRVHFAQELFWKCGVVDCSSEAGKFYCLNLRFPFVTGLKLRQDIKVTLRCKSQERVVSHTKMINVKALDTMARMVPRVATGGHKISFESDIGLYRKTFGSELVFDSRIETGGTVVLGEELLLRAVIKEGDGWRYSKISDVNVHYVEKKQRKKIMNTLWILDSDGCVNPQVHDICSREQYKVSPLETYLLFEAFMFDNMKENDEMVLNVKVTGCLDSADCILNCPSTEHGPVHGISKRSLKKEQHRLNHTANWQNDFAFKVILPRETSEKQQSANTLLIILCITSLLLFVIIMFLLRLINARMKMRSAKI